MPRLQRRERRNIGQARNTIPGYRKQPVYRHQIPSNSTRGSALLRFLLNSFCTILIQCADEVPYSDDEFRNAVQFHHLESETSSSLTLDSVHEWYLSCRANHTRCSRLIDGKSWYPTRLLDIGVEGEAKWKLHTPSDNEFPPPFYMTLSYRWSTSPGLLLLKSNIEKFCCGKFIQDLPQTFRHSIFVARRFSIRYLWIDALCILQDSQEDWERESVKMRDVYANSSCNIAASASTDPEGGLFRSRDQETVRPGLVKAAFSTSEPKEYYLFDKSYSERQLLDGPLHRRGWVFQERLLAPRVIHFTEDQVFWECFTEHKCEGFPLGIPFFSSLKDFDTLWKDSKSSGIPQNVVSLQTFNLWNDLVEEYSKYAFTRQSDKLIAFSGLSRLFHDTTRDEYLAGLWRSRLAEHLDWRVYKPAPRCASEYRAPSWSWASLNGPVRPHGLSARTNMQVSILDAQVQSSKSNAMGRVLGGHIKLNGSVTKAIYHAVDDASHCLLEVGTHRIGVNIYPDALSIGFEEGKEIYSLVLKTEPVFSDHSESHEKPCAAASAVFLVLESLQHMSNTYRRIGHFVLYEREDIEKLGLYFSRDGSVVLGTEIQRSVITIV